MITTFGYHSVGNWTKNYKNFCITGSFQYSDILRITVKPVPGVQPLYQNMASNANVSEKQENHYVKVKLEKSTFWQVINKQ